jgi:tagatose-1,6-bisphosphate aldolase non-catalytic subunit AgaZ/GatZ
MSVTAEEYVRAIMLDETDKWVRETPTVYENARIEREYEFQDGAIIRYEWRNVSEGDFNHRFTLVTAPSPNPNGLVEGLITTIDY